MKSDSLWYEAKTRGKSAVVDVTLRRCPNCGEVKVLSRPCGFDHLAAVMEFNAAANSGPRTDQASETDQAAEVAASEGGK